MPNLVVYAQDLPPVGAGLPAKNSQAPHLFSKHALSLTTFASKLAPMYGLALHCQPAFQTLVPGCIYVSG
ncbi:hypothetical protein CQ006_27855, partial [Pseudomonas cedrina]